MMTSRISISLRSLQIPSKMPDLDIVSSLCQLPSTSPRSGLQDRPLDMDQDFPLTIQPVAQLEGPFMLSKLRLL